MSHREDKGKGRSYHTDLYISIPPTCLPIVYHPDYNITFMGLEKLHPFDAGKWGKVIHFLKEEQFVTDGNIVEAREATEEDLLVVHTKRYLNRLKWSLAVATITEIPPLLFLPNFLVQRKVLRPLRTQTGGTIMFTMKRRPLLHVINFLLPILFFLSLDLASFFIADHRGEKLGFKVTVLLAISVLLLILNDILPSMSNKTPLIATYCIVIFALMLLSLLETILVTYLMEKDSATQERLRLKDDWEDKQEKVKKDNCNTEEKRQTCCSCISKESSGEKPHELLPMAEEVNNSIQSRESHVLLLILEELRELQKTLNLHLGCRQEGGKSGLWASRINRVFFIFYITIVSLFLPLIFIAWNT